MRIGANYPEKKETWMNSVYLKFAFFGVVVAFIFIVGINIISRIIVFVFKHWIWVLILLGVIGVLKYFWNKRKR